MTPDDFKQRTKAFGVRAVRLAGALPENSASQVIGKQLLRCATSVGANYRAACRAESRTDFVATMKIVEEECDESIYWIEMAVASVRSARMAGKCDDNSPIVHQSPNQSSIVNRQSAQEGF